MKPNFAQSGQWVVSRQLYEAAFEHFPAIRGNKVYQNALWYLFFATSFDQDSDRLLLCRDTLAAIKEREPANFVSKDFLRELEQNVLGEGNLRWSEWREKHCRQLLKLKLGQFAGILRGEYEGQWDKSGLIFLNGDSWSATKAKHARKTERALAERVVPDCPHAEFIQRYLNRLPRNRFTKIINNNYRNAFSFAAQSLREEKRQREVRILRRILLQPQPIYSTSHIGNTARLFTNGHIPDLKREVRKALTEGWPEADLRSSQLAISAWLWRIKPLMQFLSEKQNIWNYLFSFFDLPEQTRPAAKKIFKKALYSICFGMKQCRLNWCINECADWTELGHIIASRFIEIPLIRDLLDARSLELANVARAGGGQNCYGKWIKVNEEIQPRDVLAQIAQSWEMKIIFPAFKLAAEHPDDFKIMLFQHDGFSVHFARRPEQWRKRIEFIINEQAKNLRIPTWLEWDETNPVQSEFTCARSTYKVLM
jgi:hypothetical protein